MSNIVTASGNFSSDAERQAFYAAIPVAVSVPLTLAGAQLAQIAQLSVDCQNAIFAGFDSAALGSTHHYPAKVQDQSNLAGSVLRSTLSAAQVAGWTTPFWCRDRAGAWSLAAHTVSQIQQVGDDGSAAIIACIVKNQTLAVQVMAITDQTEVGIAQVRAIVW